MTTSFSFKILSNDVAPSENNIDLVIKSVFMQILAKSSDGFSKEFGCKFDLPSPSPASYTPYLDVTEPMKIQWIQDMYPELVTQLQESLEASIASDRQKNIIENYPLPLQ